MGAFHGDTLSAYQGVLWLSGSDRLWANQSEGVDCGLHQCEGFGGLPSSLRKLWVAAQGRMAAWDNMEYLLLAIIWFGNPHFVSYMSQRLVN